MKVLLIDVYHYNRGGAETVCFNTGRLLQQHGHDVVYFCLKWKRNLPSPFEHYFPESKETRRGVFRQVKNLVNYFYHFEAARKMDQLLRDEQPDIAHIHLIWGQITESILPVLRRHGVPVVLTAHDFRVVCPAYVFRDGRGQICERCQGRSFYHCFLHKCAKNNWVMSGVMAAEQYFRNAFFNPSRLIDGFIYVSHFTKKKHETYMPALREKPNMVLYNSAPEIAAEPYKKQGEPYFLFMGRLSGEKGIRTLVEAMNGLPSCRLKVAGTGPQEAELKRYAAEHGLSNVEFCGYQTGEPLATLVREARFIVVPSECYENNPMSIIEAYAIGTPVVGANIGGIPEIVPEGVTGFRFESRNADDLRAKLTAAASLSNDAYAAMQRAALAFAREHFNTENYYPRLIAFYRQCMKAPSTSRP